MLRGLAVLAVVLFHAKESYIPLGYLGVDVFFVISGFVVTPLVLRIVAIEGSKSEVLNNLKSFYRRRFFRLAPALALTLVISALVLTLFGSPIDHQRTAQQGIATILLIGNLGAYKYSGNYFAPSPNPLVHTWSLSVEEQIYIFLPLIIIFMLLKLKNSQRNHFLIFTSITLISFFSFINPLFLNKIYSKIGIEFVSQFSFYSPLDRIWQFTFGGIAYLIYTKYSLDNRRKPRLFNLLLVLAITIILFGQFELSLISSSISASIITFLVLIFKSLDRLPILAAKPLVWVGDRSYSIYLFHMPCIYLAKHSPATLIGDSSSRGIQTAIAVLASLLFGSLSYNFIENKYRINRSKPKLNIKIIVKYASATFVLPLSMFIALDAATSRDYWGLDRNIPTPAYAGALDSSCARDSSAGPPCAYLSPSASKTVLLIGDSHAGHISQALVDSAKLENWNTVVWTHSGCPITVLKNTSKDVVDGCIEINKEMLEWVRINSPDAVLVSQFIRSSYDLEGLQRALMALKSLTKNLAVIENNPIFPDEKDFMIPRALVMKPYDPPKTYRVNEMNITDVEASDYLINWAEENNIKSLSFNTLFCNQFECSRYSGSNWLYRDDNHFSVEGARLTVPILSNYLRR